MKKLAFGLISAAAMFLLAPTQAEAKLGVGVDAAFVLPIGDWSDVSGLGFGGLAKVGYGLGDNLELTGRLGYIFHLGKDTALGTLKTSELPILVGARYGFGAASVNPYVGAELGLTVLGASIGDVSSSETKFSLTAGGGVMLGPLDVRAQLFFPSIGDIDKFMGIMVNVGYTFVSL